MSSVFEKIIEDDGFPDVCSYCHSNCSVSLKEVSLYEENIYILVYCDICDGLTDGKVECDKEMVKTIIGEREPPIIYET